MHLSFAKCSDSVTLLFSHILYLRLKGIGVVVMSYQNAFHEAMLGMAQHRNIMNVTQYIKS